MRLDFIYGIIGFPVIRESFDSVSNWDQIDKVIVPVNNDQIYTDSAISKNEKWVPFLHRCFCILFIGTDTFGEKFSYAIHVQPFVFQDNKTIEKFIESVEQNLLILKVQSESIHVVIVGGCKKTYHKDSKKVHDLEQISRRTYRIIEILCENFFEENFSGLTTYPIRPTLNKNMYTFVRYDNDETIRINDVDIRIFK